MLRNIVGFDKFPSTGNFGTLLTAIGWLDQTSSLTPISGTSTAFNYGRAARNSVSNLADNISVYCPVGGVRGGRFTNQVTFGMRVELGASNALNLDIYDSQIVSGSNTQMRIACDSTGIVQVSTTAGGLIAQTPALAFLPAKYFFLEAQITLGLAGAGAVEVRVNTVPVISLPAVTNATGTVFGGGAHGWDFLHIQGGSGWITDDYYFLDDTGPNNTTYLGNVRVMGQGTIGNSTPLQFAIGGSAPAATNWQSVQNTALDDTKYVYDSTAGHEDLYTIEAIVNAPLVHGVQLTQFSRMDDATQRVSRNLLKSGATLAEGADNYLNQFYSGWSDIWELNPDTAAGFTGAEVNALLIGPKEQS